MKVFCAQLILTSAFVCMVLGCNKPKVNEFANKIEPVIFGASFSSVDVNNKAWVAKIQNGEISRLPPLLKNFHKNFSLNSNPNEITIGKAYNYPEAWIYIPVKNETKSLKRLVVGVAHDRCDTLSAFLLHKGNIKPVFLGKLYRNLPLQERAISLRSFALPFDMFPNEALTLVLHTRRTNGIHEIKVSIVDDKYYALKNFNDNSAKFSTVSVTCFFVFVLVSLGVIFRHKLLIYVALYMSTIAIGQFSFLYFFDDLPYPSFTYLNGNNVGVIVIFLANAFLYPFSVAYIKGVYVFKIWHRIVIWVLCVASLLSILLILFSPLTPLVNLLVTNISLVLTTLSIIWLFYISILGAIYKRENYLIITVSLIFIPILFST